MEKGLRNVELATEPKPMASLQLTHARPIFAGTDQEKSPKVPALGLRIFAENSVTSLWW